MISKINNKNWLKNLSLLILQPVNGSKNSVFNWVVKLNLLMCFFLFCFWNTYERFSILFAYSSDSLVEIFTKHASVKGSCIYLSSWLFLKTPPWNSKIPIKIQQICISQQSADLNFKNVPFCVYHWGTPWSHWIKKETVKKLNLWGKTAVGKSAWIKAC